VRVLNTSFSERFLDDLLRKLTELRRLSTPRISMGTVLQNIDEEDGLVMEGNRKTKRLGKKTRPRT